MVGGETAYTLGAAFLLHVYRATGFQDENDGYDSLKDSLFGTAIGFDGIHIIQAIRSGL